MNNLLSVTTYNVHHRRDTAAIRYELVRLIEAGADVLCLQEMGGHQRALETLPVNWRHYLGRSAERDDTPIAWNADVIKVKDKGERVVSTDQRVEDAAGGNTVQEKSVVWVGGGYRDRTTRPFVFMNTHAVASVEGAGEPAMHHPQRLDVFKKLMIASKDMVHRRTRAGRTIVYCGDFNVDWRHDNTLRDRRFPVHNFHMVNLRACYADFPRTEGGTEGSRLIDYVWYTPRTQNGSVILKPVDLRLLDGYGSDHKPVMVTFEVER